MLMLILYLSFLLWRMLFFAYGDYVRGVEESYRFNLIPLKTITVYVLSNGAMGFNELVYNLLGNIVVFIPIGFMIKAAFRELILKKALLAFFAIILMLETLQLISKRGVFDVDDLILNLVGCTIGYFLFYIIKAIRNEPDWRGKNEAANNCRRNP